MEVEAGNARCQRALPQGACAWGWWRKPWESHHGLLERLSAATREGSRPQVLLYNQYLRRLYKASLHDFYFEPGLTTVAIPAPWRSACPPYYRDKHHLCGAFFALEIDPNECDARELDVMLIDSASLEFPFSSGVSVLSPPLDVPNIFRGMVDRPPKRAELRSVELSMFLLRSFNQRDSTAALIEAPDATDEQIALAVADTEWDDLTEVFCSATPAAWARLSGQPKALAELGIKARTANGRLTRMDFYLFSEAVACPSMRPLLLSGPDFSQLGAALRAWVTEQKRGRCPEESKRGLQTAWTAAAARYDLEVLPGEVLPGPTRIRGDRECRKVRARRKVLPGSPKSQRAGCPPYRLSD